MKKIPHHAPNVCYLPLDNCRQIGIMGEGFRKFTPGETYDLKYEELIPFAVYTLKNLAFMIPFPIYNGL
jgi:hypothetical protein